MNIIFSERNKKKYKIVLMKRLSCLLKLVLWGFPTIIKKVFFFFTLKHLKIKKNHA